ncbi:MAG: glycosyltransferase family 2 protein, partial [Planctomycetes bacterium]|nr:glycosyltransferase family 2 protein [Planctomycetota bacterium]
MFWQIYHDIALVLILTQLVFLFQSCKNYGYALRKSRKKRTGYKPRTWLTVPCKGIDNAFDKNIASLFNLDYDDYYLAFVVEDSSDPAYERLCRLKEDLAAGSKAMDVFILTASIASGCSQKIHNLLYSCRKAPDDIEVFAFADSDACLRADWLSHLVHPLRKARHGAATGYRWFVPERNNLASLALSAINAKIAQMLGNTSFNQAWGGSMAIRTETFRKIGLDSIWQKAISDDLALSYAVKKAGLKINFTPACLVASYEETTWPKL